MRTNYTSLLAGSILVLSCGIMLPSCDANRVSSRYPGQIRAHIVTGQSLVRENILLTDQIKEFYLSEPTDLTAVEFLDDANGWVGGKEKLFKTEDGGQSWQQPVKLEVLPGSSVRSITIVNRMMGWIILQRSADLAINYEKNRFWILRTVDGGSRWTLQYDGNEANATALKFTDEKTGWLTGIKYGGLRPFRYSYLVLHTKDQGEHWQDAAEELTKLTAARKQVSIDSINDAIMGISGSESSSLSLITGEGEVFRTSNDGRSWERSVVVDDKSEQTGIRQFGSKADHKLWFLSSAHSIEGVWSTLNVEQIETSWTSFRVPGIYLSDAVALSARQFLACGSEVSAEVGRPSRMEGVILYTQDDGQKWSIVYRNKTVKAINSLNALKSGLLIAVGDKGLVLRLQIESLLRNQ